MNEHYRKIQTLDSYCFLMNTLNAAYNHIAGRYKPFNSLQLL